MCPTSLYHAANLDPFDTADSVALVGSLAVAALAAVLALAAPPPRVQLPTDP